MGNTPDEFLSRTRILAHEVFYHGDYYERRFSAFMRGKVSLSKNSDLWTKENYNHWIPLRGTMLGSVGLKFLQESQKVIHSYDASHVIFQNRCRIKMQAQRTINDLAKPNSVIQLKNA